MSNDKTFMSSYICQQKNSKDIRLNDYTHPKNYGVGTLDKPPFCKNKWYIFFFNPADGRHWISWPIRLVASFFFPASLLKRLIAIYVCFCMDMDLQWNRVLMVDLEHVFSSGHCRLLTSLKFPSIRQCWYDMIMWYEGQWEV